MAALRQSMGSRPTLGLKSVRRGTTLQTAALLCHKQLNSLHFLWSRLANQSHSGAKPQDQVLPKTGPYLGEC